MSDKIRVGALISGGGTNLQAIIDACEQGVIDAQLVCVGSDNPRAHGLERARKHAIPGFVVDYKAIVSGALEQSGQVRAPADFDLDDIRRKQGLVADEDNPEKLARFLTARAAAEAELLRRLAPYRLDLLVLAGFMRTLTPYFIDRFNTDPVCPRIMNIHPALLPAFPGTDGYGDTYRYGCKVGGCTVHFIDYGEDSGPIIGQQCFPIADGASLDEIRQTGLALEWRLYPECIQLYAKKRLVPVTETHTLKDGRVLRRTIVKIAQPAA